MAGRITTSESEGEVIFLNLEDADRSEPPPELIPAKTLIPRTRPSGVVRSRVLERLRSARETPIVAMIAPAGYGKTTALAQWAHRDRRPFAWVTLDEHDDDPSLMLSYVRAALESIGLTDVDPIGPMTSQERGIRRVSLPRLAAAVAAARKPFVLVLDNIDSLSERGCFDAVQVLADNLPMHAQLAVSGRSSQSLPIARLRASGTLLELRAPELAMDADEAAPLLDRCGVDLSADEVVDLVQRTEGWPVGLYLAALSIGAGGAGRVGRFSDDDRFVADYLSSELLSRMTPDQTRFLRESSVLRIMSGPSCDAVLQGTDSARMLRSLEDSNLFIHALGGHGGRYRYHRLFRELLVGEMQAGDPVRTRDLRIRAADWCRSNGMPQEAVEYAMAAGDPERVAELVTILAMPTYEAGRLSTVWRWLKWLDEAGAVERHPPIAILGAWLHAVEGRPTEAERWVQAASHGSSAMPETQRQLSAPWISLLDGSLCRFGPEQMARDAEFALDSLPPGSSWRLTALITLAFAHLMSGDSARADRDFADSVETANLTGLPSTAAIALAERALIAMRRGDWDQGEVLAQRARSSIAAPFHEEYMTSAIVYVACVRANVHRGNSAPEDLGAVERLLPLLTYALPHLAVQIRIELAHAYLGLSDTDRAAALLREIEDIRQRRPDLGVLFDETAMLASEVDRIRATRRAGVRLTTAELRLLPFLATHLSFREIGERLYLSPNTVKTQAISVYRKLGVASRGDAVRRAREHLLLEH